MQRHTTLRSFDLSSGAPKIRWDLPGENSTCNDFSIGPDKALYITDTANAKIYRLASGASGAELYLQSPALAGVDGITFLDGTMYVNNVRSSKIYRIPASTGSKPGEPVEIQLDQPVKGPDGMRAAHGRLFVAENGNGRISAITLQGDKGSVAVLRDGLHTPTGVEPAGGTLWIAERGAGKVLAMPMP